MNLHNPFDGMPTPQEHIAQLKQNIASSRRRYEQLDRAERGERPFWKRLLWPQPLGTEASLLWIRIDMNFREATTGLPKKPSATLDAVNEHFGWVREREGTTDPAVRSIMPMTLYSPLYAEAVRYIDWENNYQAQQIIYHLAHQPKAKHTPVVALLTGLTLTNSWEDFQTVLGLPEDLLDTLLQEHLVGVREQHPQL